MLELRLELPEEETRSGIGFFLTWDSATLRDRLERATDTTLRQRIGEYIESTLGDLRLFLNPQDPDATG
eukprot:9391100-Alexandrium_andersonii.AAC.1